MAARTSQKGFTLIEIIAVLVILGILAAVAVPKYMALQQQATQNVLKGAIAAAQTRLSWSYAQLLIELKPLTSENVIAEVNKDSNCGVSGGDFTVTCTAGGPGVLISAIHVSSQESATGNWALP